MPRKKRSYSGTFECFEYNDTDLLGRKNDQMYEEQSVSIFVFLFLKWSDQRQKKHFL